MKPGKIIFIVFIIFAVILAINLYNISTSTELTDFSSLSTNDTKNLQVRAVIARELPMDIRTSGGSSFSVRDLNGKLYSVKVEGEVPDDFHTGKIAVMLGHLHADHFHAASVIAVE
jgi:cytochrome c-type biogenesis protein CcmE